MKNYICIDIKTFVGPSLKEKKVKFNLGLGIIDYDFGFGYGFEIMSVGAENVNLNVVYLEKGESQKVEGVTLKYEEMFTFTTPTMDAGAMYTIYFE